MIENNRIPELIFKRKAFTNELTDKKLPKYLSFYDLVDEYMMLRNNNLRKKAPTREQMDRQDRGELTEDEIRKFSRSGHYNGIDLLHGIDQVRGFDYKLRWCAMRSLMIHAMEVYAKHGRFFDIFPLVYEFYKPLFSYFYAYKLWEMAIQHTVQDGRGGMNSEYYIYGELGIGLLASCLTAFNREFGEWDGGWMRNKKIDDELVSTLRVYMRNHSDLFPGYEGVYEIAEPPRRKL